MSAEPEYSTNERAERIMGRRLTPEQEEQGIVAIDFPCELGYRCPVCQERWDEGLQWSEYASFLWCERCNRDYPSVLCIDLSGVPERSWDQIGIDAAVKVYLDSVERSQAPLRAELDGLRVRTEQLKSAILDIDAHATPLGEDDDGFVSVGSAISVGCLHRALGLVGHSAKCRDLPCERAKENADIVAAALKVDACDRSYVNTAQGGVQCLSPQLTYALADLRAVVRSLRVAGETGDTP